MRNNFKNAVENAPRPWYSCAFSDGLQAERKMQVLTLSEVPVAVWQDWLHIRISPSMSRASDDDSVKSIERIMVVMFWLCFPGRVWQQSNITVFVDYELRLHSPQEKNNSQCYSLFHKQFESTVLRL